MNVDEYLNAVRSFAVDFAAREDISLGDYVSDLKDGSEFASSCVALRQAIATHDELAAMDDYLEIGHFTDGDEISRRAWWLFLFDITHAYQNVRLEAICEPYRSDHALFQGAPKLLDHIRRKERDDGSVGGPDFELIDAKVIRSVNSSEVYALSHGGFSRLAPQLEPRIAEWANATFPFRSHE